MTATSFAMIHSEGKIARGEAEVAAKQEEAAGVSRESDRKQMLLEALASQSAGTGMSGISAFEGSPLAIMEEDVRREKEATERDVFQTELKALTLRSKGKIAETQARTKAMMGFLSAGFDTYASTSSAYSAKGGAGAKAGAAKGGTATKAKQVVAS